MLDCAGGGGRFGANDGVVAQLVDIHQEIGEAALDTFEQTKPRIRSVKPFDQRRDAILEMGKRRMIGIRELRPFEFLDQAGQQLLKFPGHGVTRLGRSVERAG